MKVSDEFTVPLCRGHHRALHQAGNEVSWWDDLDINALEIARGLWEETHPKLAQANPSGAAASTSATAQTLGEHPASSSSSQAGLKNQTVDREVEASIDANIRTPQT